MAKQKGDFSKMKYNPTVRGGRMIDHYAELKHYEEFQSKTDLEERLVRFAFLITDENSPIKSTDYQVKVKEACIIVDIKEESIVNDLLLSANYFARKAITRCFIISHNYNYTLWYSYLTSFNELNYMLMMPVLHSRDPLKSSELKLKIGLQMEEYLKQIVRIERLMFKDDYVKGLVRDEATIRTIHYAEELADPPETIV